MLRRFLTLSMLGLALAGSATAQTRIDPNHAFAWQENCGWMNFGTSAATPGSGAVVTQTSLEGHIWSENLGWISLSSAAVNPAQNHVYSNVDDHTYGVNIDSTGELSGFAWSENAGWINFHGGAEASPPNPARLDRMARRFFGLAWGERIGWLNLDDSTAFVAVSCPGDFNLDGGAGIDDIFLYIGAWFQGDIRCDTDQDTIISIDDLFLFITVWFRGC